MIAAVIKARNTCLSSASAGLSGKKSVLSPFGERRLFSIPPEFDINQNIVS
jgi:hypothetical protein